MPPDGMSNWLRLWHQDAPERWIMVVFAEDGRISSVMAHHKQEEHRAVMRRLVGGRRAVQREMGLIR